MCNDIYLGGCTHEKHNNKRRKKNTVFDYCEPNTNIDTVIKTI